MFQGTHCQIMDKKSYFIFKSVIKLAIFSNRIVLCFKCNFLFLKAFILNFFLKFLLLNPFKQICTVMFLPTAPLSPKPAIKTGLASS